MESKELNINIPEGYEVDLENSDFVKGNIKFKLIEKELFNYDDVAKQLFFRKHAKYIGNYGLVLGWFATEENSTVYPNICTSKNQGEKLLAINKLLNVAKFLNENWVPDWDNGCEYKYYIYIYGKKHLNIDYCYQYNYSLVYFKNIDLAKQAIDILGEETIRLALCTDW